MNKTAQAEEIKNDERLPLNEGLEIVEHGDVYIVRFLDGTFFKQFETGKTNRVVTTRDTAKANGFPTYDSAHNTIVTIESKFDGAGVRPFQG